MRPKICISVYIIINLNEFRVSIDINYLRSGWSRESNFF